MKTKQTEVQDAFLKKVSPYVQGWVCLKHGVHFSTKPPKTKFMRWWHCFMTRVNPFNES